MGIGSSFSDYIAGSYVKAGYRFFSKTVNPALGEYREKNSHLWKPTVKNGRLLKDNKGTQPRKNGTWKPLKRRSYCHEFINDKIGNKNIILHKIKT